MFIFDIYYNLYLQHKKVEKPVTLFLWAFNNNMVIFLIDSSKELLNHYVYNILSVKHKITTWKLHVAFLNQVK